MTDQNKIHLFDKAAESLRQRAEANGRASDANTLAYAENNIYADYSEPEVEE